MFIPTRRGPVFANPEASYFANPEGPNLEGSCRCQSGRVLFYHSGGVPIRRRPVFANPEGSFFANPEGRNLEGSYFLPIRRSPNSEGFFFGQLGGFLRIFFITNAIVGILART